MKSKISGIFLFYVEKHLVITESSDNLTSTRDREILFE